MKKLFVNNKLTRYRRAYILTLSLLALFTISTQVFIQFLLYNQRQDVHTINIAGRQRMLSQQITKQAFVILNSQDVITFQSAQQSLEESLDNWDKAHKALQYGDETLGIKNTQLSDENKALFAQITASQQIILNSGKELVNTVFDTPKSEKERTLDKITTNEGTFLDLMDKITFQFEQESNQRAQGLARLELILMITTLVILALESWLIFRPITNKISNSIQRLEDTNRVIEEDRRILKKNNVNLEIIKKALLKQGSDVEKQKSLLEVSESISETSSFDLLLPSMKLTFSDSIWTMFDLPHDTEISFELALSFIQPESINKLKKSFVESTKNKRGVLTEIYQARMSQQAEWCYFQLYCKIFYNDKGEPFRVVGSIRNVHEQFSKQKELEAVREELENKQYELQNAYDLLEKSSEAARIGSWEIDLKADKMNWSQFSKELHGIHNGFIPENNIVEGTEKWLTFYSLKEEQGKLEKALHNCLLKAVTFDIETRIEANNGQEKWVRVIGIPTLEKSRVVRMYGLFQDIDERKKVEADLKNLAIIAEKTNDLIVVTDNQGCVEWVNDSFTRITEYTFEEVKGKKPGTLLQGPDTQQSHIRKISEGITRKKPFSQEILNYTKSGKPYWNYINITPILDSENNIIKFIGIQYDITKLKKAEKQIQIKNKELQITLKTIKKQQNDILASIEYAQLIQKAILSDEEQGLQKFQDSFILFEPRDIISGDFYWFSDLGERQVVIMADCTGHGVPGAFMTMLGATALNEIINEERIDSPHEVLYALDKKIRANLHSGKNTVEDGMDLGVLFFEKNKERIRYSGAKTPLYFKFKNQELKTIKGSAFSVGSTYFLNQKQFISHQIEWKEDTWFYLASDGFQDQFSYKTNKKFMRANFRKLLSSITNLDSKQQLQKLQETFQNWKQNREQTDDVSIIGIHI